jgi:hypothetical protein
MRSVLEAQVPERFDRAVAGFGSLEVFLVGRAGFQVF